MKTLRSLAFAFLAALALAAPARAQVEVTVTTLADEFDTPSGGSVSLREAVRDVGGGPGTIFFDPSLEAGVIALKPSTQANGGPLIRAAAGDVRLTINALALPKGITVDGQKQTTFFSCASGSDLKLLGLTFKDGATVGTVDDDLRRAPIVVFDGNLTAELCTFSGNRGGPSGLGGAVAWIGDNGRTLTISGCTFADNVQGNTPVAGGGGALFVTDEGTVNVTNSTFFGNDAGICTARDRQNYGGAIRFDRFFGDGTVRHCTIAGNKAAEGGGGIAVIDGTLIAVTFENSIVAGNASFSDVILLRTLGGLTPRIDLVGTSIVSKLLTDADDRIATQGTGTVLKIADPKLGRFGYHGGRNSTFSLKANSPAIDGASKNSGLAKDQRGLPRVNGARADIGAFEYAQFSFDGSGVRVTTTADELDEIATDGTGVSLREALAYAAAEATITFDPLIFDGPKLITLKPELGPLTLPRAVNYVIDAVPLSAPVTVSGNAVTQVLRVNAQATLEVRRLDFQAGNGAHLGGMGAGGAIHNAGTLILSECGVTGNSSAKGGGGIDNSGTLLAQRCTFSGNTANTAGPATDGGGGALLNHGRATLENCTLSGNTATFGGAIDQLELAGGALPVLVLNHCTIAGNTANELEGGGGIFSLYDWTLKDSIVAGNTAVALANDVTNSNDFGVQTKGMTRAGVNIVPALVHSFGGKSSGPVPLTADPMLDALNANGGPTATIALQAGSPAIDAASAALKLPTGETTDQRGFAITGKADLGAYEFGAFGKGQFKAQLGNTTMALREGPAAAPIVITNGDSELTLTVNADGTFKGTLTFLGAKYSFSGQFAQDRTASIPVTGRNLPALTLDLTLSGPQDNNLSAKVTGAGFTGETAERVGETSPTRRYLAPPEVVGRYTYASGDIVFAFEVTKAGLVRLAGRLVDGTAVLAGTRLEGSTAGVDLGFSLRIPLYKKKGYLQLDMTANPAGGAFGHFFGTGTIFRPAGVKPAFPASRAGGFTIDLLPEVTRYTVPPVGAPFLPGLPEVANMMHARFTNLGPLPVAVQIDSDLTLPPSGIATSTLPDFKLKVNRKTGFVLGKHPNPTPGGKPLPFVGVLVQDGGGLGGALSFDANVPYQLVFQIDPF